MKTDIEIANEVTPKPIIEIASKLGLNAEEIIPYGHDKAKVSLNVLKEKVNSKIGKLVLVTAINPTAAGEGKSTVSIGLADALNQINKNAVLALREPSLGPVMGIKGGATGGGYSQVIPMADINLHFTGDIHAITTANNALASIIDNHIFQGNELNIDNRKIQWKRCLDINDRALREIVIGLGGEKQGIPREDGFDITVASEIMAVLCLATSESNLKERLGNMIVAYNTADEPVTVNDLGASGVLAMLLKDAINPNLVQTLEHTPTFIHGGPFANIAHGCNSVLATNAALHLGDYAITEAGFGSDLGGEKFLDIVSHHLDAKPNAVVVVATTRALKLNAGVDKEDVLLPNIAAVKEGFVNLEKHIENMQKYGVPMVVAINKFATDTEDEINLIKEMCEKFGSKAVPVTVWADGGQGGLELAHEVVRITEEPSNFKPIYENVTIIEALEKLTTEIYGGAGIELSAEAIKDYERLQKMGLDKLPVCVAKTPVSLSDDATKLGRPTGFTIKIRRLIPKTGAGFIVALAGNIMTMPGLPKVPAALKMDINDGIITGLF